MQIAQRATSSTTTGYGSVDRFRIFSNGADEAPTHAQVDVSSGTTPYTNGFRKALKVTNGNQTSGTGASDYIAIQTRIEAQDMATCGWNYTSSSSFITLQFWVKSSVAQNFYGYIRTKDGTEQRYPFETGSLTADTWTKITKTIPGASNIQFDNNEDQGFQLLIAPFWGTNYTSSDVNLNAWAAYATGTRTPDYTSTWYTTNDATFEVTGLQLEVGSQATPFEHRSFGEELALCQRYYFKPHLVSNLQPAYQYHSQYKMSVVQFPTTMRVTPTCTASWAAGSDSDFTQHNNSKDHFKAYRLANYDDGAAYYIDEFEANAEL